MRISAPDCAGMPACFRVEGSDLDSDSVSRNRSDERIAAASTLLEILAGIRSSSAAQSSDSLEAGARVVAGIASGVVVTGSIVRGSVVRDVATVLDSEIDSRASSETLRFAMTIAS